MIQKSDRDLSLYIAFGSSQILPHSQGEILHQIAYRAERIMLRIFLKISSCSFSLFNAPR